MKQCLSQDFETGCLKLAVVKFMGVQIFKGDHNQEIRSNFFFIINTYLRSLEAISRACSGHPKGRLSFGSLSLWKILAMIIAEGLLNVASKIQNRPWFV